MAIGSYLDIICEVFNNKAIPALIDMNGEHFKGITDYPQLIHGDVEDIYPNAAKKLLVFPFPIIIVFVYLALSMAFNLWHPFWMIFLTIPMYYRFAIACKANNKKTFILLLPVPEMVVMVFLALGFAVNVWKYASLLFLMIPLFYWLVLIVKNKRKDG